MQPIAKNAPERMMYRVWKSVSGSEALLVLTIDKE